MSKSQTKTKKLRLTLLAVASGILLFGVIFDLLTSTSLMNKSLEYAASLQKHTWLKYPMYFFSYGLFFFTFFCKAYTLGYFYFLI